MKQTLSSTHTIFRWTYIHVPDVHWIQLNQIPIHNILYNIYFNWLFT